MKLALLAAATLVAVSPAWADPLERLRDASANELCWDPVRNFAREKYPTVQLGAPIKANLISAGEQRPFRESRKAFPGIRTC